LDAKEGILDGRDTMQMRRPRISLERPQDGLVNNRLGMKVCVLVLIIVFLNTRIEVPIGDPLIG
jgi:hypothetical protein